MNSTTSTLPPNCWPSPAPLQREGDGWRLAVDPAKPFVAMVGGENWACELRAAELQALCHGVTLLVRQHCAIAEQLMAEESITINHESRGLWIELSGTAASWSLRFLLEPEADRGCEGAWSAQASPRLAMALQQLDGSGTLQH
ncbi:MAG: hypothetical protein TQ37_03155 [Candidatus Synechococcus spongiarum 15L]|uniref:DUF1818 domain-containing protein n=1 Tax=Candidatus Synechococcus spongiarum 15L TaxID=1608419 RepID=A0A0G8AXC7_9SYNE|nr:MAG: hypothetical protein TQ37_03155 [Candidatus Synechococcus spongiarum 15L]